MSYYNNSQNEGGRFRERGDKRERDDRPAFSRLFVVCSKHHSQDDLKDAFRDYGHVEDVWIVKDKNTKENRGIAYIQYAKMSEACLALETLNGKKLPGDDNGPALKVIMAQPRSSQSNMDLEDATALTRLFVLIPRGMEESEVREKFTEFGEIDYVQVVKDRNTGEKKGFGYVKFLRAYDAARALEEADKVFKAVMVEPKAAKMKREVADARNSHPGTPLGGFPDLGLGSVRGADVSVPSMPSFGFDEGLRSAAIGNRLQVNCAYSLTSEQLARLFDLIPGMELCDLKRNFSTGESKGLAIVVYNSVGSATYAKEKLNGFEYPPGSKLTVRYAPDGEVLGGDVGGGYDRGLAGVGAAGGGGASPSYCNVELPPTQPRVKTDEVAERLFIVCQPTPPPDHALLDVFSRFGDLIDVFTLKNKNFGYAKYASVEAAEKAMKALHGAEVCGARLKVLAAEPPKTDESARKRPRT